MTYDYLILSSDEFEKLSHDLLEKKLDLELERFKPGKDNGIDLRHYLNKDEAIIIQCKRYKDFTSLKRTLKNEVEKVQKLNPKRYIITTTVPLSPANKAEIQGIFEGFIQTPSDIFGKDDLDDLLENNPEIEKRNFKLWLSSVSIMQKILQNNIMNRSEFTEAEIKKDIRLYVQNESLNEAKKLLQEQNLVILSGNPGVGKTTLAKMLILELSIKGYEIVTISRDIDEAEGIFQIGKKQVFYYDDFLGSNFLEDRLEKNEDKRLLSFINKIKRTENNEKKFIMTTREYILNQARMKYESFNSEKIEIAKHIVDVEAYTEFVKAKILYNHLFFSDIPSEYIESLISNKNYMKIIRHRNYNPRVIESMTINLDKRNIIHQQYIDKFIDVLNHPKSIWEHSFKHQITAESKYILYILTLTGSINILFLKEYFKNLSLDLTATYSEEHFDNSLKELENTFISISLNSHPFHPILVSSHKVDFQNPSIRDYLLSYIADKNDIILSLWKSSNDIDYLFKAFSSKNIYGKIQLSDKMIEFLSDIAIEKYYSLKKDSLKLNWLKTIGDFFDLKINKLIRGFILKEILAIDQFYNIQYSEQKILLDIISFYTTDELPIKEILIAFIENITETYETDLLTDINLKFPDIYKQLSEELNIELIISKIIETEIEDARSDTDFDFDSFIELLSDLQLKLDLDLENFIDDVKQFQPEYPDDEPDFDDDRHLDYERESGDTTEIIDDMFDTLLK